ncbi:DUF2628 domain-containing protein [Paenibacillus alba]|uniref:DUF2628 domain-containing protein n=1 Tax=Paenibacillus alba TaxID=1197127 RepID=A0ABU6GAP3_9BACL|nr:DUF2628 domain-containing protein [Paenibacillus alba]MEC0231261.1 DUF2628 domain-containing protein [Paenibacillus alba]
MFCSNCGDQLISTTNFCGSCGNKITNNNSVSSDIDDNELTRQIIGKNDEFYLKKWSSSNKPEQRSGWNWAAFFLTFFWMGYRKMHKLFIIFIATYTVIDLVLSLTGIGAIGNYIGIVIAIIFGSRGNAFYYAHVKEIKEKHKSNPSMYPVGKIGGTSWSGVFLVAGLLILSGLILYIFE